MKYIRKSRLRGRHLTLLLCALLASSTVLAAGSQLNHEATPYLDDDDLPRRVAPLLEIGPSFLDTGNIPRGFELFTGAVWTPSLWVYGDFRTALQAYEFAGDDTEQNLEWVNRLDLFANLQLSGTERVLIGFTPTHERDTAEFTGLILEPEDNKRTVNAFNMDIDTLFFEADIAELFPGLDRSDSSKNDYGISIGRQNITFMDGFLVNDNMDGVGISKNNIRFAGNPNIINMRSSLFVGLRGVNRNNNVEDDDSRLVALFNQVDTPRATYNFDVVYVKGGDNDETDLVNVGFDQVRRIGKTNFTFRAAYSHAVDEASAVADDGTLLFAEWSWVPAYSHDNLYINAFLAIDQFTSAARGPLSGGPLGRTGLLFAAQGIGSYPAPLDNRAQEAAGIALGYQHFFPAIRAQFIGELGARENLQDNNTSIANHEAGFSFRYQQALGRRYVAQLDGYATKVQGLSGLEYGMRMQLQVKF